jgi:serine/threonine-protein kinase
MQLEPGSKLGHYEIVSSLGAGGMGEVYRAKDMKLGREVAIKVLLDEVSSDPERLARFEREARVLASLNHPNIATLHGFDADAGTRFLVMELVEGETLADRIARGSVPLKEAIVLFTQIAEGLDAAHEQGIIHRDLKPANIKISDSGMVKVLDFGLAKAMEPEAEVGDVALSQSPTLSLAATQRGQILGTAAYMAPEQARAKPVDKRADVWAFGCCLYEALTAVRPFEGEDGPTTLARVLDREPDWERLEAAAPEALTDLVRNCLEKAPGERLRDIGDARIALRRIGRHPVAEAAMAGSRRQGAPKWGWLAAGLAVGAVAGAVWLGPRWAPREGSAPRPVRRYEISLGALSPTPEFEEGAVALSPDGSLLALTAGVGPGSRIYLRRLDSLEMVPMPGTEFGWYKFFSPDNQWVVFDAFDSNTWYRSSVDSIAEPIPIVASSATNYGGAWSNDGYLYFNPDGRRTGLSRVPIAGGSAESVTVPDATKGETGHSFPDPLPDGRGVLFTIWKEAEDTHDVAVLDAERGVVRTLVEGGVHPRYVSSGHVVYGAGNALYAVAFDVETLTTRGSPMRVVDDVILFPQYGTACFAISETGVLAYVPTASALERTRGLSWIDREGNVEPLDLGTGNIRGLDLAPDGQRLAYVEQDAEGWHVFVMDLTTGRRAQITERGLNSFPVWTPGGDEIIFGSNIQSEWKLFRRPADRGREAEPFVSHGVEANPGSFADDGTFTFYRIGEDGTSYDIWTLPPGAGEPEPFLVTADVEANPRFSADGQWIAYEVWNEGESEVWVRPYPVEPGNRQWKISTSEGANPLWSPTRSEIYFLQGWRKLMAVRFSVVDGQFVAEAPRTLFEHPTWTNGFASMRIDIAADGERFLAIDAPEPSGVNVVVVENWAEELARLVPTE